MGALFGWLSRNGPYPDAAQKANIYYNGFGGSQSYGSRQLQTVPRHDWRSVKTPGWKTKKKRDMPINAFSAYSVMRQDSVAYAQQPFQTFENGHFVNRTRTWDGTTESFFPTLTELIWGNWSTADSNPSMRLAEQRALSKVSNQKINIAQAFAERKQTANLLVSSVNRFVTLAVAVRKGNFSKASEVLRGRPKLFQELTGAGSNLSAQRRFAKAKPVTWTSHREFLANGWLEYSYGWRPLLADVYGAAELCAQLATKSRPTSVTAQARSVDNRWDVGTKYGITARSQRHEEVKAKCKLWFDVTEQWRDSLKSTGISNPALLAWELLPYSFVADWFLPVGDYLGKLGAENGLAFVKGMTTANNVVRSTSTYVSNTEGYINVSIPPVWERAVFQDRIVLTTFPEAQLPRFQLDLNMSQVASGLALISQFFKPGRSIVR
jgi:hypothetical protein